ncbi:MAG TPA: hypothetical protein VFD92_19380 [Candidatus Binatia bacterium]|nr:hypothetical protein [Candidatus Binatia bacterium]
MKSFSPYEASILSYLAKRPMLDDAEREKLLSRLGKDALAVALRILSGEEQDSSLESLRSFDRREDAVGDLKEEAATARAIRHWVAVNSRSS